MKNESEIREELERANTKLAEIEKETRVAKTDYDKLVCERRWKEQHGYIEAL